jgi:aldose 1-epimerase
MRHARRVIDVITMRIMPLPSGEQFVLEKDGFRAVITEIGATLRSFSFDGVPIVWGFPEDELCSAGRGQVLAPWPNRIEDGTYHFEGTLGVVPLDEPARNNAIHGLVRWLMWRGVQAGRDSAKFSCVLSPQPAYPFWVSLDVTYGLTDEGLLVTTRATNLDNKKVPFGLGFHSYFAPTGKSLDESSLIIPARRHLVLDDRLLVIGEESVVGAKALAGSETREGQVRFARLRDVVLDDCFGDLERDANGRWYASLIPCGPPGHSFEVWGDATFKYIMCFTGESTDASMHRKAVAIEPMTCPPNAFRSGTDLVVLDPGASYVGSWGIAQSTRA